jgi:hypothetical protein
MRKHSLLWLLPFLAVLTPQAFTQDTDTHDRGDFGIYFDYTRLQAVKTNFFGIGARAGVNINPHIAVEGEFAYDFNRSIGPSCPPPPATVDCLIPSASLWHGLFGAKIQTAGPVRMFALAKGGFLRLDVSGIGTITGLTGGSTTSTHGAFYPGGGVEFGRSGRRWAIRLEAGDEIFWDNGANHNFKFMGGPQIRF